MMVMVTVMATTATVRRVIYGAIAVAWVARWQINSRIGSINWTLMAMVPREMMPAILMMMMSESIMPACMVMMKCSSSCIATRGLVVRSSSLMNGQVSHQSAVIQKFDDVHQHQHQLHQCHRAPFSMNELGTSCMLCVD